MNVFAWSPRAKLMYTTMLPITEVNNIREMVSGQKAECWRKKKCRKCHVMWYGMHVIRTALQSKLVFKWSKCDFDQIM